MKKLLTLWILLFTVLLASCDDTDVAEVTYPTEEVYVSQMTETALGVTTTYSYNYEGNKLTSVTAPGYERLYTYVNDLLVREEIRVNGVVYSYTVFSYTADKALAQTINISDNGDGTWAGFKRRYARNTDGTLTVASYRGNETGQYDFVATVTLTYTNGTITKGVLLLEDVDVDDDVEPLPYITTLGYDNGKAPFKNIFGYEGLVLAKLNGGVNNLVSVENKSTIINDEGIEEEQVTSTETYTYTYNENNYPLTETGNGISRQYTYTP